MDQGTFIANKRLQGYSSEEAKAFWQGEFLNRGLGVEEAPAYETPYEAPKFSVDDAKSEINQLRGALDGPYWNHARKFSKQEQDEAVARVQDLQAQIQE